MLKGTEKALQALNNKEVENIALRTLHCAMRQDFHNMVQYLSEKCDVFQSHMQIQTSMPLKVSKGTAEHKARLVRTLDFIKMYINQFNEAPTQKEIAAHVGLAQSTVNVLLRDLQSEGHIIVLPGIIRGIELVTQKLQEPEQRANWIWIDDQDSNSLEEAILRCRTEPLVFTQLNAPSSSVNRVESLNKKVHSLRK